MHTVSNLSANSCTAAIMPCAWGILVDGLLICPGYIPRNLSANFLHKLYKSRLYIVCNEISGDTAGSRRLKANTVITLKHIVELNIEIIIDMLFQQIDMLGACLYLQPHSHSQSCPLLGKTGVWFTLSKIFVGSWITFEMCGSQLFRFSGKFAVSFKFKRLECTSQLRGK